LHTILEAVGSHQKHSEAWLYKRRFLFKVPGMPVGVDGRAVEFIRDNMHQPVKRSQAALRRRGVKCSVQTLYRIWMAIRFESVTDAQ